MEWNYATSSTRWIQTYGFHSLCIRSYTSLQYHHRHAFTHVPVQKLCVNIHIYIYIYMLFYMSSVFFGSPIVSCSLMIIVNTRMPVTFGICLNSTLILSIWCSTIHHLPGCFCPWTFFQNIGFNMVSSDPFMSHLATQLDILQGSFKLCNWLSLRCLVSWINHLPPACWSTFWKSIFKHQLGCRFDILDSISSFCLYFDICNYLGLDTSYHFLALSLPVVETQVFIIGFKHAHAFPSYLYATQYLFNTHILSQF